MNKQLFGRGVSNGTSKVSVTSERVAGGGSLFGLMCMRMSPQFFTRGWYRGVIPCVLVVVFALSGVFSIQAGAQAEHVAKTELRAFANVGDSGVLGDNITKTFSASIALLICDFFRPSGTFFSSTFSAQHTPPSGSSRSVITLSTVGTHPAAPDNSCYLNISSNQFPVAFLSVDRQEEGVHTFRARPSSTATWGPETYITIDNTAPTVTVLVSDTDGTTARTALATATDLNGVYEFEVADNHTGTCDATGTASATFVDYDSTQRNVQANTEDCFRVTDVAANVAYASTGDGVSGTTDAPALSLFVSSHDSTIARTAFATAQDTGGGIAATGIEVATNVTAANCTAATIGATSFSAYDGSPHSMAASQQSCFRVANSTSDVTYASTATATVDTTAPVITIVTGAAANTFTASATDTSGSGIATFEVATSASESNCIAGTVSTQLFGPYTSGDNHSAHQSIPSCFKVTDGVGNVTYASTEDAVTPAGVHSITYRNDGSNTNANNNLLINRTFTIHGTTTASAEYRLFVRAAGSSTWPAVPTAAGTAASSDGSVTSISITLNADGDYELATQVREEGTFVPETLAVNSEFTIDTIPPAIESASLVSDNSNDTSLAMEGDTLTLTFVTSEALRLIPNVSIAGQPATVSAATGTNTYEAEFVVTSSTDEGAVKYNIGELEDVARLLFNPDEVTSSVIVDRTNPTLTIVQTAGSGTAERTVIAFASDTNGIDSFEIADNESTCASSVSASSFSDYMQNTPVTVQATTQDCFRATDNAGNTTYTGTADAISGIASITYKNSDSTAAATGNLLKSNTFTIEGTTTPSTEYRLFVRAKNGTWPVAATASGTSASSDGSITSSNITLNTDGDYELATQIKVGSDYLPATLAVNSEFSIDTTAPAINNPALVSDNSNDTSLAMTGDDLTLTFTVSETLTSAPSVTIAGQTVTATESSGTYSATVTVSSSTDEGAVTYDIGVLTDVAGNTFNQTETTSSVIVDRTNPTLTIVQTAGSGTAERTVTAFATDSNGIDSFEIADNESTCASSVSASSFSDYMQNTPVTVQATTQDCFRATDNAGNVVYVGTADAISGIASIFYRTDGNRIATNNQLSTRTFTVHGTTTPSTEYRLFVRAKNGTWPGTATVSGSSAANGSITSSNITLNTDGDYELATQIRVGSEYLPATLAVNSEFSIDTTAPTISSSALVSDNSNDTSLAMTGDTLTLTFTTSETLASAPSATIAGETVTVSAGTGTNTYEAEFDVTGTTDEGAVTYDIGLITDAVGNTFNQTETTSSVIVDRTNPTLTIVQTAGSGTAERTVTAFATDSNGINTFQIADDEATCSASASKTFGNYTQNTPVTVQANTQDCFRATDNAGNTTYASTTSAIAGVGGISYTNNDSTPAAAGNLLKTNTFTIAGTTATTTNYRLFVRAKDANWPAAATASGTSAANGSLSQTLTQADGDYETAFQIEVNNSFVPALASLVTTSEFTIDGTAPAFTLNYAGSPTIVNNTGYYTSTTLTTGGVTVSNIVEANLATATLTLARTDTTGIPNLTPASAIHSVTGAVSFANATSVPNGTYTATVVLTDDAGNTTTKTLNLVVDSATPTITGITIADPSARTSVEATLTVRHNQTTQETLTATLVGQDCTRLNPITLTGSGTSTTDIQLRGRTGTFSCTITLTDQAGNTSSSFTIPTFTIERSSSGGGGGGVRSGGYVGVPTFQASTPSVVPTQSVQPTQPTQPTPVPTQPTTQAPLSPELQERIALLKLALNKILERIQYLIAQKTNG